MRELAARCALLLAFFAPAAFAQGAPDALLRAVADEVIGELHQARDFHAADQAKIADLVEAKVLPLFDFARMTQLTLARNWHLATAEQRRVLTEEFKTLLVRTYSAALTQYRGERIAFRQVRAASADKEATVRSEVKQSGNERMFVDYDMENTPQGWKIYGVKVAGVCLVTSYRDLFNEKVREGGVSGLIMFLAERNRGGESRFKAIQSSFWEKSRVLYAILQRALRSGLQ